MHLDEDRNSINVSAPGSSACPHSDHFGGGFTRKYVLFLFRHLDELTLLMSNSAQPNKAPSLEAVMSSCSAAAEMNTYCRCRHFLTLLQTTPRGSPSLCKLLTCVAVHWLLWRNPFIVRIIKLVTTSRFFRRQDGEIRSWRWSLHRHDAAYQSAAGWQIPLLTYFHHYPVQYIHTHSYTLSPPPPLRWRDSFVTKMNSSSALQPKQVIWLPRPQIKLVWFNFRFGLLLQPYIKGDIFHYTAKPQASSRRWPTPSIGRHHGSIMAFTRYCCRSSKAGGGVGAIGWLVIHGAARPRTAQPTCLAWLDRRKPSCDKVLAGPAAWEMTWEDANWWLLLLPLWNHLVGLKRPARSCFTGSDLIVSLVRILIQSHHLPLPHPNPALPFHLHLLLLLHLVLLCLLKVSSCVLVG